eukprot:scaffold296210_cov29-Tisochrysis_lutea.AAC.1
MKATEDDIIEAGGIGRASRCPRCHREDIGNIRDGEREPFRVRHPPRMSESSFRSSWPRYLGSFHTPAKPQVQVRCIRACTGRYMVALADNAIFSRNAECFRSCSAAYCLSMGLAINYSTYLFIGYSAALGAAATPRSIAKAISLLLGVGVVMRE